MSYKIYTDGASRGNPGKSGAGGVIKNENGEIIESVSEYLGIQTNNYAEYKALELTLIKAIELGIRKVEVYLDSKLVVEQVNGRWKINNQNLLIIHSNIIELLSNFDSIKISHILRKFNKHADLLANNSINNLK